MFLFDLSSLERKSLPSGRQVADCSQERQPGRCLNAKNPANVIRRIIFFFFLNAHFLLEPERKNTRSRYYIRICFTFHSLICPDKISNLFLSQFLVKRKASQIIWSTNSKISFEFFLSEGLYYQLIVVTELLTNNYILTTTTPPQMYRY